MRREAGVEEPRVGRRSGGRRLLVHLAWQLAASAAFVVLGVRRLDLDALGDALRGVEYGWLVPALATFTLAKYVDSWRWRYLLRGVGAPPQRGLFAAFLIGNMVNNALPLRLGDVAKVQVLANRYGTSRAGLAASVFVVEASLDGVVFVLFLLAALLAFDLPGVSGRGVGVVVAVSLAAFLAALALAFAVRRGRVPKNRATRLIEGAGAGLHVLGSPGRVAVALALSVPAWLIEGGMFALFGRAFGVGLDYPTFVAVMVAANLAVAVPVALWNFGPYEALVSAVLVASGVPQPDAVAYALAVHVGTSLWIQATGVAAFIALGVRPRDLLRLHASADAEAPGRADAP